MKKILVSAAVAGSLIATAAKAVPVIIDFTAEQSEISGNSTPFLDQFIGLSAISGSIEYDTDPDGVLSTSPTSFQYLTGTILIDQPISLDSSFVTSTTVTDNPFNDVLAVRSQNASGLSSITFALIDDTASVFSDTLLPTSLDPTDFGLVNFFTAVDIVNGQLNFVRFEVNEFSTRGNAPSPVPLPAGFPLLVAGLLGLGWYGRRKA